MTPPFPPHGRSERRGRRCPAAAHAGAVYASLRLRCGAHAGVASPNSLRALRALRSNNCDESDHEARCARRPRRCAPRRPRNRRHRAPPAALCRFLSSAQTPAAYLQRRVRAGRSAPLGRRAAQGSWPRAQRELSTDSSHLFERSERSSRSELCDGAARPSSAGKSSYFDDRTSEALRPALTRLCRSARRVRSGGSGTFAAPRIQASFAQPVASCFELGILEPTT
jgi:hypothetical protein